MRSYHNAIKTMIPFEVRRAFRITVCSLQRQNNEASIKLVNFCENVSGGISFVSSHGRQLEVFRRLAINVLVLLAVTNFNCASHDCYVCVNARALNGQFFLVIRSTPFYGWHIEFGRVKCSTPILIILRMKKLKLK